MSYALWSVGILAIVFWIVTRQAVVEAYGDNFGAGAVAAVAFILAIILTAAWIMLAAIRWWPW